MSALSMRLRSLLPTGASVGAGHARKEAPGGIMVPRVLFLATTTVLVLFGLLMIYSSSSIVGLTTADYDNNPAYFLMKQLVFVGAGIAIAVFLSVVDYHRWSGTLLKVMWGITLVLLIMVRFAGLGAYGATRWMQIGSFTLQPSEFAKVVIVLTGARICEEYFWQGTLAQDEAVKLALGGLVLPLILIVIQPDKGTTGVLLVTLLVMSYLSGVSGRAVIAVGILGLAIFLVYSLKDEYARARILTMINPERDPYGEGYQLMQGLYAFGSGGLTGVGIGFSRQKYNYLPMAHNDFIFAVIGEELGLVGTLGVLVAFALLAWAGLKIAEQAPDLMGRLIAAGCTTLIIAQFLLNVSGVVGVFPLSGKPVPFISYGGSSVISCFMLVGLVTSVSLRSTLPETAHERRRAHLRVADEDVDPFGSYVGEVQPRSARQSRPVTSWEPPRQAYPSSLTWKVIEGGASKSTALPDDSRAHRSGSGRVSRGTNGRTRIDLGPSGADRLWNSGRNGR